MSQPCWPIGLSLTLGPIAAIAKPPVQSPVQIGNTARQIAVRIESNLTGSSGSGVLILRQGDTYTLLTAAHVLRGSQNLEIFTPDGRRYPSIANSIRQAQGNLDLATLQFKSDRSYPVAKLGNSQLLQAGSSLYVAGFPRATQAISSGIFNFTKGEVTANSDRANAKGYSLIYSNPTLPGMSGGPVLNEQGELVAIHGQGDRSANGQKTGFNLGIVVEKIAHSGLAVTDRPPQALPTRTKSKADDYYLSANEKFAAGDYAGAARDFDRAITMNPRYAFAYNDRGNLRLLQQDLTGALADYNQAIALKANFALAYGNRGNVRSERRDFRGALADYNRAINLDPRDDLTYNNRGLLKDEQLNDVAGALADYNKSIALNPYQYLAYNNRGNLHRFRRHDIGAALADYNLAIQLNTQELRPYYNRADLKYAFSSRGEAIQDFERVVVLAPRSWMGAIAQGVIDLEQGRAASALTSFQRASELGADSLDVYKYQGLAYKALGQVAPARTAWQRAAKIAQQRRYQGEYRLIQSWLN